APLRRCRLTAWANHRDTRNWKLAGPLSFTAIEAMPYTGAGPAFRGSFLNLYSLRVACLAALLAVSASAQQRSATQNSTAKHPSSPVSAPPAKPNSNDAAAAQDFSKEPFVIEKYSTSVRFENDGTGERE